MLRRVTFITGGTVLAACVLYAIAFGALLIAAYFLLIYTFATEDVGRGSARDSTEGLLVLRSPPPFLLPEPNVNSSFLSTDVDYLPTSRTGPSVNLEHLPGGLELGLGPRNPIEWLVDADTSGKVRYYAAFDCGDLTIRASVMWEHPENREQVLAQLSVLTERLNRDCAGLGASGAPN